MVGWNSARMKFRTDVCYRPQLFGAWKRGKCFGLFFCGCWPLAGGSMDSVWRMSMASAQPLPRSGRVNVPCLLTDWNVCVCLSTGRCLLGQHLSVPRSGYFWGATDGRCHLAAESFKIQFNSTKLILIESEVVESIKSAPRSDFFIFLIFFNLKMWTSSILRRKVAK